MPPERMLVSFRFFFCFYILFRYYFHIFYFVLVFVFLRDFIVLYFFFSLDRAKYHGYVPGILLVVRGMEWYGAARIVPFTYVPVLPWVRFRSCMCVLLTSNNVCYSLFCDHEGEFRETS